MHDQKAWCRFSEEDIEGMVGRPLTLFLTKLTSMTPTLREVNALCAMHTLPPQLLANILTPEELHVARAVTPRAPHACGSSPGSSDDLDSIVLMPEDAESDIADSAVPNDDDSAASSFSVNAALGGSTAVGNPSAMTDFEPPAWGARVPAGLVEYVLDSYDTSQQQVR